MLAGAAMAQQPDEQEQKHKQQHQEKAQAAHAKPAPNPNAHAAKPQMHAVQQQHAAAVNEHATSNVEHANAHNAHKAEATLNSHTAAGAETNVSGQANVNAMHEAKQHRKEMKAANVNAKTNATQTTANTAAATSAANQQNAQVNAGGKKKPDPQKVQQIKQQHANFRAQPKPEKVPAVTFQQNYRIQGADQWQGRQYDVFRSYHSEWHDRDWYHSHFNRVVLVGGGYYYWNNGYWFPAWGYDPGAQYYAYDAPIYVGHAEEPPDRVIADVQATLQDMGYYKGEVDGLLGPLTREALASYQADNGLTATAVIDEPTLDSLRDELRGN